MSAKDNQNSNDVAVHYLGRTFIIFLIGFFICVLAYLKYNVNFQFSKEKIEVQAENSNSTKNDSHE